MITIILALWINPILCNRMRISSCAIDNFMAAQFACWSRRYSQTHPTTPPEHHQHLPLRKMSFMLSIISNAIICYMHPVGNMINYTLIILMGLGWSFALKRPFRPELRNYALNCTQSVDFCARHVYAKRRRRKAIEQWTHKEKPRQTFSANTISSPIKRFCGMPCTQRGSVYTYFWAQ